MFNLVDPLFQGQEEFARCCGHEEIVSKGFYRRVEIRSRSFEADRRQINLAKLAGGLAVARLFKRGLGLKNLVFPVFVEHTQVTDQI